MSYVYLFILFTLIALVICFRNHRKEAFESLSPKKAPLKILYGFSMLLIGKKHSSIKDLNQRLKSISLGLCAFILLIGFGFLYSISSGINSPSTTKSDSSGGSKLEIADNTDFIEDSAFSSETGTIEGIDNEQYLILKDTIATFEKYREDIEKEFLGENESYLSITKPLNLISEYGEEKIIISWSFETEDVIDKDGNIIYENIDSLGCSTLAYATLTLNDTSATLTIPICISPP